MIIRVTKEFWEHKGGKAMWGESDEEKFAPDGRYGRWLEKGSMSASEIRQMESTASSQAVKFKKVVLIEHPLPLTPEARKSIEQEVMDKIGIKAMVFCEGMKARIENVYETD